jgi:tetratricopeptide (TPR) repeat protein
MGITKSRAWKAAEWDYDSIQADIQMAALLGPPSQEGILKRLRSIIRRCPQFYPAILELGVRLLRQKGNRIAERMMEKGFRLMIELAGPTPSDENIDRILENLENTWRFDISMHLLEVFSENHSLSASQHDSMAHAAARLGEVGVAQQHIDEALKLEPSNKNFWTNKGWYHLMKGELDEADQSLSKAGQIKRADPVIEGNIKILKYLREHGGTYWDYLERPLDRGLIDRLADSEKWDQATGLCNDFNACRIEAFAQSTFLKSGTSRSLIPDMLSTLNPFFDFVSRVNSSGKFLHEDIGYIKRYFKPIMHKFIYKFGDVDSEMMENLFKSLQAFYGFLATRRIVDEAEFADLQKTILGKKDELLDKMKQYNAVRHDSAISEKNKEKLRKKLFEGDHASPHI